MIIYNVTSKVHVSIATLWARWMIDEHMPALIATGLFIDSRLCRLLEQDEADGITFSAQYTCDSLEDYHEYIARHATAMHAAGLKKWGDKFVAFRTVMQVEG